MDCVGPDRTFNSYKQMHHILIDRNAEIKKTSKKNPTLGMENFRNILIETADTDEWSRGELVDNSVKYLGSFNASMLMPEGLLAKLEAKGVASIDEISESGFYWFIIGDTKAKKTKNGKPYLLLTAMGLGGQNHRVFCWGWDGKTEIPKYATCISEITVDGYGNKTFMSKVKIIDG